eukprot:1062897-Pyramimonas_sp.AAC.1
MSCIEIWPGVPSGASHRERAQEGHQDASVPCEAQTPPQGSVCCVVGFGRRRPPSPSLQWSEVDRPPTLKSG